MSVCVCVRTCVCVFPQCVIVNLIRLASESKKQSEKWSNAERERRSQQTGEEVIKSSLTNPVELASIKPPAPPPPPPPPPFLSSSSLLFFAVPPLSSNHFYAFSLILQPSVGPRPPLYPRLFFPSTCSHGYLMTLSIFCIVKSI